MDQREKKQHKQNASDSRQQNKNKPTVSVSNAYELATTDEEELLKSPVELDTSTPTKSVQQKSVSTPRINIRQAILSMERSNAALPQTTPTEPNFSPILLEGASNIAGQASNVEQRQNRMLHNTFAQNVANKSSNVHNGKKQNVQSMSRVNKNAKKTGNKTPLTVHERTSFVPNRFQPGTSVNMQDARTSNLQYTHIPQVQSNQNLPQYGQLTDGGYIYPKRKRGGVKWRENREKRIQIDNAKLAQGSASTSIAGNQARTQQTQSATKPAHNRANARVFTEATKTTKRNRQQGETPPDLSRITKAQRHTKAQSTPTHTVTSNDVTKQPRPSMAEVVGDANLLVAVIDMPIPGMMVPFTKEKYDIIFQKLNNAIFAELDKEAAVRSTPQFSVNKFVRGHMKIRCSTPAAKSWLHAIIPYIPSLWENMSLKVVDYDKIPSPFKILGLFPKCTLDCEKVRKYLGAMNACIDIERWTVLSDSQSDIGKHIVFAVTRDQIEVLNACNFQLFFGASTANFKDISAKKDSNDAQNVEDNVENATEATEMEINSEVETDFDEADDNSSKDSTVVEITDDTLTDANANNQNTQSNQNNTSIANQATENIAESMQMDAEATSQDAGSG